MLRIAISETQTLIRRPASSGCRMQGQMLLPWSLVRTEDPEEVVMISWLAYDGDLTSPLSCAILLTLTETIT